MNSIIMAPVHPFGRRPTRPRSPSGPAALLALCLLVAAATTARASGEGRIAYLQSCAACHGENLEGKSGPPLAGTAFAERWTQKQAALFDVISKRMPLAAPGSLSPAQYRDIFQYIRAANRPTAARAGGAAPGAAADGHAAPGSPAPVFPSEPKFFGAPTGHAPDDSELLGAAPADWLSYNRDLRGQRFSPLSSITAANAAALVPKCLFQLGEIGTFESSPLIRNGWMYITTAHGTYAIDAATCRQRWAHHYAPTGPEPLPSNRGAALYEGMVVRGTPDGHLIALDAEQGRLLWDTAVNDSHRGYFLSGAPVAFDGKIFVAEAGADFGAPGHTRAFDAKTGKLLWTFDMVPSGNQPGADSWPKGSAFGGSSSWSTITVDPIARLLFVPSGNPGPDFKGTERTGDNLYSDSVVVLDEATGKLQWYVQQIPHDVHDWDTGAAPAVYSRNGRNFMAVGSKDARLYLYDRDTHALISRVDVGRHLNDDVEPTPGVPIYVCPGVAGGVEWNGPAYDPGTGLLFVNSVDKCVTFTVVKRRAKDDTLASAFTMDPPEKSGGTLTAIDAVTGAKDWTFDAGAPMLAGVTPTASGVLFTGSSAGDFLAFDAKTGRKLYSFNTGGPVAGGISVYDIDGGEYVAVESGNNSKSVWSTSGAATVIVFGLPAATR